MCVWVEVFVSFFCHEGRMLKPTPPSPLAEQPRSPTIAMELEGESSTGGGNKCDSDDDPMPPPAHHADGSTSRDAQDCDAESVVGSSVGGKPKSKKHDDVAKFFCKNCMRWESVLDRVPSYQVCRISKRAYDGLKRVCIKQGEMDFFNDLITKPKDLKLALGKYSKLCPGGQGRGTVRAKSGEGGFKLAELKEELIASTSVTHIGRGQMMWKEQYIIFAATAEGFFLTRPQATAKWESWAATDSGMHKDNKGPEVAPLRIRVNTEDLVDFTSAFTVPLLDSSLDYVIVYMART
jgi:hypothetical protein